MTTNNPNPKGRLFKNWISLAGAILAVASAFAFLLLFVVDIMAHHGNPYMGILAYVITPMFLFVGLGLIGAGYWHQLRLDRNLAPGQPMRKLRRLCTVGTPAAWAA